MKIAHEAMREEILNEGSCDICVGVVKMCMILVANGRFHSLSHSVTYETLLEQNAKKQEEASCTPA